MVGIDIGSSSVKLVELRESGGSFRLENAGESLLPGGSIVDKAVSRKDVVSVVVSNLVSDLGVKAKKAVIGVSGKAVAAKAVTVPEASMRGNMKKLAGDLVRLHLFKDVGKVNYSCVSLAPREQEPEGVRLLLAASPKKTVSGYRKSVSSAGLRAEVVDMDAMALLNAYASARGDVSEKTAIVNVGASVTSVNVSRDGAPFFVRDVPLGGWEITRSLMEKFDITYEEAERIKYSVGGYGKYDEAAGLVEKFVVRAAAEIKTVLDEAGGAARRLVLCGGSARLPALADSLEEAAGVPVEVFNPFGGIAFSDSSFDPEYLEYLGPKMAVAVGLAARGF